MEMVEDKTEFEIKNNLIYMKRTTVESCDAEEYLRRLNNLKQNEKIQDKKVAEFRTYKKMLEVREKQVQKMRDEDIRLALKERKKANEN